MKNVMYLSVGSGSSNVIYSALYTKNRLFSIKAPPILSLNWGVSGSLTGPTASWARTYAGYYLDATQSWASGTSNAPRSGAYAYNNSSSGWDSGVLLEGYAINTIQRDSNNLTTAGGWTVNSGISPTSSYVTYGVLPMTRVITTARNNILYASGMTIPATAIYVFSYFLKDNGQADTISPGIYDSTAGAAPISTQPSTNGSGSVTDSTGATIVSLGNLVKRIIKSGTLTTGHVSEPIPFANFNSPQTIINDILLAGMQVELGHYPSSPAFSLSTGPVSRDADIGSFNMSGTTIDNTNNITFYADLIKQRPGLIFYWGSSSGTGSFCNLIGSASVYQLNYYNGTATASCAVVTTSSYNDHVQLSATLSSTGSLTLSQIVNGVPKEMVSASAPTGGRTTIYPTLTIASTTASVGEAWDTRKSFKTAPGIYSLEEMSNASSL